MGITNGRKKITLQVEYDEGMERTGMAKTYRVGCKGLDELGRGKIEFNQRKFAVSNFLPGEKGQIELVHQGKETKARLVSLEEENRSADRVKPACPVFERCGGCQLMHMRYEAQLAWKQKELEQLFAEEAGEGKILPILGMEQPFHYRHKVYATFSRGEGREIVAGIYEEDTHRVVKNTNCMIQDERANAIIEEVVRLMKETKTLPYEEDRQTGVLRHIYIRTAAATNQIMVVLVTGCREFWNGKLFADDLMQKFPEIRTVVHNINRKKTSAVLGDKEHILRGPGYMEDVLCGFTFRISSRSFYQVNPVQTELLYRKVLEFAALTGKEIVLDAYCGIGTLSLLAAERAGKVLGVEINADAVRDARINAGYNRCGNVAFFHKDAGALIERIARQPEGLDRPDVIIMDPPRSGSTEQFLNAVIQLAPQKLIYVSCNPHTQKQDTDYLKKNGYQVDKLQAVDCFGHTYHVETVVLLSKGIVDSRKVKVDFSLEDMDLSEFKGKATYEQIKAYVLEQTGLKVSSLYIAQIKKKCGLDVGENFNLPKSENARQPQCTPEKEEAIMQAFKHFGIV